MLRLPIARPAIQAPAARQKKAHRVRAGEDQPVEFVERRDRRSSADGIQPVEKSHQRQRQHLRARAHASARSNSSICSGARVTTMRRPASGSRVRSLTFVTRRHSLGLCPPPRSRRSAPPFSSAAPPRRANSSASRGDARAPHAHRFAAVRRQHASFDHEFRGPASRAQTPTGTWHPPSSPAEHSALRLHRNLRLGIVQLAQRILHAVQHRSSRASIPIAPCPAAGRQISVESTSVMRSAMPSRSSPAFASTMAS